jgi:hypothetical protein
MSLTIVIDGLIVDTRNRTIKIDFLNDRPESVRIDASESERFAHVYANKGGCDAVCLLLVVGCQERSVDGLRSQGD